MKVVFKPFTEDSLGDAAALVRDGFGEGAVGQLHKILANPIRDKGESAGDVMYEDGKAVGFQAAIKRVYFNGKNRFVATIPGMLVVKRGGSPANLLSLIECTAAERFDRTLVVANTAIPVSQKLFNLLGLVGKGPASCETIRFAVLKVGGFLRFCSHGRLPSATASIVDAPMRLFDMLRPAAKCDVWHEICPADIDDFWQRYLKTNEGIVASRTAAELQWLFEEEMQSGTVLFAVSRDAQGKVNGYAAAKESRGCPGRWMLVDWIAIRNDTSVLQDLLVALKRTLCKTRPNAFLLESVGFPDDADGVLARSLPFARKTKNNVFVYQPYDQAIEQAIAGGRGWFFGPVDGDRCLAQ